MIRGIYTSAWSMLALSKKMDVVSNNLANVDTNAFKKDTVVFESFPAVLTKSIDYAGNSGNSSTIGNMVLGSDVGEVYTNFSQGALQNTGNNLDFALQDDISGASTQSNINSFFTIGVPGDKGQMDEYYTRDGAFALNQNNQLVTKDGYPVLGENGPITLKTGDFTVGSDGTIVQNGATVGKLLVKSFQNTTDLRKFGSNLYQAIPGAQEQPFSGSVMQGNLEQSNVNIISEMVDMITVTRSYEASQKMLQAQDETLDKAVNEVGSIK
jgi:flagellar basal-body rod protein FlgF